MGANILKLCECGCGEPTNQQLRSNSRYRKGEFARFKKYHATRGRRHAAKLTSTEVVAIRKKAAMRRQSLRQIAGFYGVSKSCVEDVVNYRTWKDV